MKINKKVIKKEIIPESIKKIDNYTVSISYNVEYEKKFLHSEKFGKINIFTIDPTDMLLKSALLEIETRKKVEIKLIEELEQNNKLKVEETLHELILHTTSIPIMLYSAIESFVNQRIFEEKMFNKQHYFIQRYVPLKEKLFKIIPEITYKKEYFLNNKFSLIFEKINSIRNNVVHQKMSEKMEKEIICDLLDTDWGLISIEVKKVINDLTKYQ